MVVYSRFSHSKWWFSIVMLEKTRGYKPIQISISIGLSILNHPFLGSGRPEPLLVWLVARGAPSRLAACMAIVQVIFAWYFMAFNFDWGCEICTCLYVYIYISAYIRVTDQNGYNATTKDPVYPAGIQRLDWWLGETNVPSLGMTSLLFCLQVILVISSRKNPPMNFGPW